MGSLFTIIAKKPFQRIYEYICTYIVYRQTMPFTLVYPTGDIYLWAIKAVQYTNLNGIVYTYIFLCHNSYDYNFLYIF